MLSTHPIQDLLHELCQLLRHLLGSEHRKSYLVKAFGPNWPPLSRLKWESAEFDFTQHTIFVLFEYGTVKGNKNALCYFLESLRDELGLDNQRKLNDLVRKIELRVCERDETYQGYIDPKALFQHILTIDFDEQVRLVKKVLDRYRAAAFLIQGSPFSGQQVLLARLLRFKKNWISIRRITVDFGQKGVRHTPERIWWELAKWLGLSRNTQKNIILDRIHDLCSQQDVLIILDNVSLLEPDVLKCCIKDFWNPLVSRINPSEHSTLKGPGLIMFLIDWENKFKDLNSNFFQSLDIQNIEQINDFSYPFSLPENQNFSIDVLEDWINRFLPFCEEASIAELSAESLYENSENGCPEFVYEEVCNYFKKSWEGELAGWLG